MKRFFSVILAVCLLCGAGTIASHAAVTTTDLSECMDLSYGALAELFGLEKVHWDYGSIYPYYYSDFSDDEIATYNRGAADARWSNPAFSFYGIKPGDAFSIPVLNAKLQPHGFSNIIVCDYPGPGSGDYVTDRDYNATLSFKVSGGVITKMGLYYRSVNEGQNAALIFDTKGGTPIAKYVVSTRFYEYTTVALPSATRAGYSFLGWSESQGAATADWLAGGDYTITESKTLYAVYGDNSEPPAPTPFWSTWPNWLRSILDALLGWLFR